MTPEKKRIYIAVKTYPAISEKYSELVCTAGVLEDGSWIRLYPVPFRLLNNEEKYPKYTWIQSEIVKNTSDFRKESFRPILSSPIKVEPKPRKVNWEARREILFKNKQIHTNLHNLIEIAQNKNDPVSLALFKPQRIIDFKIEADSREWDAKKLASLHAQSQQFSLFQTIEEIQEEFRVVQKVPYKFSYLFEDDTGKRSKLMIEDWEIGMLYFNCLKSANGNEKIAVSKVKERYLNYFLTRDVYFILGTTLAHHYISNKDFASSSPNLM